MHRATKLLACTVALCALASMPRSAAAAPLAELVSVTTEDKVLLHGLYYAPLHASRIAVVHLPGGPGAFYSAQDMGPLAESLTRRGYQFLSINLRTAGANGLLYSKFDDYQRDIAAAMRLATSRGASEVILLAHSLSSARAFYYVARTHDPLVKGLVVSGAITSPYEEAQMRFDDAKRADYDRFLATQRELVKTGQGRQLASYEWGPGRILELSAGTWVDLFGSPTDSNASTVKFASEITLPVLIVHGTKDPTALPANAERILAALTHCPKKDLVWIDGADHLFTAHAGVYAERVSAWIAENFPNKPLPAARH